MTETPHQAPPGDQPPPQPDPPSTGLNTQNLKDYRHMRRARADRKVAGVAAGLGRHLDVDPTVLRVLFVVMVFFGGAGLLLYGALWLFVPEEGTERTVIGTSESTRNALLVSALVIAGLLALGDSWNGYGFPWPLAVVALIVVAVLMSGDNRSSGATVAPPGAAAGDSAPPWYPTYAAAPHPPTPQGPGKTGPLLSGFTLALIALALGLLGLYDTSGGSVEGAAYPALALAVTGATLVVGAFYGRAGGLVVIGIVSALALGGAAIGNPGYDGDRDLVISPTDSSALLDSYDVPAGRIELDLTRVRDPEALDGRGIALSANAGEIVVIVPRDVDVSYDASIDYGGAIETPEESRDGWGSALTGALQGTDPVAEVELDIDLHIGHIELRQQ